MTLPLDAARSPDSRLMSVVFPAPFGPTTACSFPNSMPMATRLTAARPPKRRVRSRVVRIVPIDRVCSGGGFGSGIVGLADQCPPEPAGHTREPAGQEDHQQDDRGSEQELPVVRERLENFRQRHEREGADNGAIEAAHSAENQHQQYIARLMPGQKLRVDESELKGRQITRETGNGAGEREACQLV